MDTGGDLTRDGALANVAPDIQAAIAGTSLRSHSLTAHWNDAMMVRTPARILGGAPPCGGR
jgi:hypothetical protein